MSIKIFNLAPMLLIAKKPPTSPNRGIAVIIGNRRELDFLLSLLTRMY